MSIEIKHLDGQTPVRKSITKKVILAMKKYRQKKKLTADLLGEIIKKSRSSVNLMGGTKSKLFLRKCQLELFAQHYNTTLEKFLLSVDKNVSSGDLVGTYFNLNQEIYIKVDGEKRVLMSAENAAKLNALKNLNKTGEVGERDSLKEVCSGVDCDRKKFFVPDNDQQRQKLISGIYALFSFSEGWQFWKEFKSELESEFLETGIIPESWREKIADKTDLAKFVGEFQKEEKPIVSRKPVKKSLGNSSFSRPDAQAPRSRRQREYQKTDEKEVDMPMVVVKAFLSACFNAGVVEKDGLAIEVSIGTLIRILAPDFAVIFFEKDKKFVISGKGKIHTLSFENGFPWEKE